MLGLISDSLKAFDSLEPSVEKMEEIERGWGGVQNTFQMVILTPFLGTPYTDNRVT